MRWEKQKLFYLGANGFREDWVPGERIRCLLNKLEQHEEDLNSSSVVQASILSANYLRWKLRKSRMEPFHWQQWLENCYRTKVCVKSTDPKVDPVGACVCPGFRVKSIVREMNGEKVDIVRWLEDPVEQLAEALKPASLKMFLWIGKKEDVLEVVEDDLSVAIGRKGINARLTSRLLGWKLDIGKVVVKQVGFDERKAKAAEALTSVGIEFEVADRLLLV